MQMINKNNKGITLIILVITIVVLIILVSITVNYGTQELHEVSNKKLEIDLKTVQEAIMQRYALIKAKNLDGILALEIDKDSLMQDVNDTDRPDGMVGTRVCDMKKTLDKYGFPNDIDVKCKYTSPNATGGRKNRTYTFETYYYLLDENDLSDLGIIKETDFQSSEKYEEEQYKFLVNYSTGEVFDIANKRYWDNGYMDNLFIYDQPGNVTIDNGSETFSDD